MQFTTETDNNFFMQDEPFDDLRDQFSSSSLYQYSYSITTAKHRTVDVQPPPNSKDKHYSFIVSPMSPNFEQPKEQDVFIKPPTPVEHPKYLQIPTQLKRVHTTVSGNFIRYAHVRRLISRLMRSRYYLSKLKQEHFSILNDNASHFIQNIFTKKKFSLRPPNLQQAPPQPTMTEIFRSKVRQVVSSVSAKLDYWDAQINVFQPETQGKIIWDCVLSVIRIYYIILIPLDISFSEPFLFSRELYLLTIITTVGIVLDTVLNFNTAYYQYGQIVQERSKIARHVISKAYGFDLLSVLYLLILIFLDWEHLHEEESYILSGLLFFVSQYGNIRKVIGQIEEILNLNKIGASLLELMKLIILLIYILHLSTCIWYAAGRLGEELDNYSWIVEEKLVDTSWSVRYLRSFYFCAVTMFTVGYGDVTPKTNLEYFLCCIMIMIFSIQLPYSVNTVGAIIDQISKYNEERGQKLRIINHYMSRKKIKTSLQSDIRQYLNYFWEKQLLNSLQYNQEKEIISSLSENLRESLMLEANQNIVNMCQLFDKIFSPQFKSAIVKKLRQISIQPESMIDYSQEFDGHKNQYLTFIEDGEVQATLSLYSKDVKVGTLKSGSCFGLHAFLTDVPDHLTYQSIGFVNLFILPKQDFMKILKEFPEDKEKFCEVKDDFIFNNGEKYRKPLALSCQICQSMEHFLNQCPLLHFQPDRERTIKRYTFEQTQDQPRNIEPKQRKTPPNRLKSLLDRALIEEFCKVISQEFSKESQLYELGEDNQQYQQSPAHSEVSSDDSKDHVIEKNQRMSQANIQPKQQRPTRTTRLLDLKSLKAAARKSSISPMVPRLSSSQSMIQVSTQKEDLTKSQSLQAKENSEQRCSIQTEFQNIKKVEVDDDFAESLIKSNQEKNPPSPSISPNQQTPSPRSQQKHFPNGLSSPIQLPQSHSQSHEKPEIVALNSKGVLKKLMKDHSDLQKKGKVKVQFQAVTFFTKLKKRWQEARKAHQNALEEAQEEAMQMKKLQLKQQTILVQKNNLSDIQQRLSRKSRILSDSDNKRLDALILELNMQLSAKFMPLQELDTVKEYKHYMPQNNFSHICTRQKFVLNFIDIWQKLNKYMLYPTIYIQQYKHIPEVQDDQSVSKPASVTPRVKPPGNLNLKEIVRLKMKLQQQRINQRQVAPETTHHSKEISQL